MARVYYCTHKKHPGKLEHVKKKCIRKNGCPWLEYEEVELPFVDNHKRF